MLRILSFVALGACSLESPSLSGTSSNPALTVEATADFLRCDGSPCTNVTLGLWRDSALVRGAQVQIALDDEPPQNATTSDAGGYGVTADRWIHSVRIDVVADGDTAALWSDAALSTADEAGIQLPDRVVLGDYPELTWTARHGATKTILFSALAPHQPHVGFLATRNADDGHCPLGPALLDATGRYQVALIREMDLSNDDANLFLTWESEWSEILEVVNVPPT